jgi:hypothetical protein
MTDDEPNLLKLRGSVFNLCTCELSIDSEPRFDGFVAAYIPDMDTSLCETFLSTILPHVETNFPHCPTVSTFISQLVQCLAYQNVGDSPIVWIGDAAFLRELSQLVVDVFGSYATTKTEYVPRTRIRFIEIHDDFVDPGVDAPDDQFPTTIYLKFKPHPLPLVNKPALEYAKILDQFLTMLIREWIKMQRPLSLWTTRISGEHNGRRVITGIARMMSSIPTEEIRVVGSRSEWKSYAKKLVTGQVCHIGAQVASTLGGVGNYRYLYGSPFGEFPQSHLEIASNVRVLIENRQFDIVEKIVMMIYEKVPADDILKYSRQCTLGMFRGFSVSFRYDEDGAYIDIDSDSSNVSNSS